MKRFSTRALREHAAFGTNPGALRMFTYVPRGLPAGAPLVVILHGCRQDALMYLKGTGWPMLAEHFDFAILAPEQTHANNMRGCFNWFLPGDTRRDSGEAASIRQMIDAAVADYRIDTSRIFICGLSAGGAMTSVMLADYPEVFNAGAIIAGLPYGAANSVPEALIGMKQTPARSNQAWGDLVRGATEHTGRRPRVSVWHSDMDETVHPSNADAIIAQWTNVMSLEEQPTVTETVLGYPHSMWRDKSGDAVLESYTIMGLAHGTPIRSGRGKDACGEIAPFILEAGISSTLLIAEFWGLTRKNAARPGVFKRLWTKMLYALDL